VPWWFLTDFPLEFVPPSDSTVVRITFKGINYRANIYCNGVQIGNATYSPTSPPSPFSPFSPSSSSGVIGPFRYFDFDVASIANWGGLNSIAVEVFRPYDFVFPPSNNSTDLAITFIDWSPPPPDSSMGLWREIELSITGDLHLLSHSFIFIHSFNHHRSMRTHLQETCICTDILTLIRPC